MQSLVYHKKIINHFNAKNLLGKKLYYNNAIINHCNLKTIYYFSCNLYNMPFFIINIMDSIDIILLQREVSKYKAPPNGKIFQIIITIT